MELIDKDAVVAEIERLKTIYNDDENIHHVAKYNILVDILSFINTLEVKEVDLKKEIDSWYYHLNIPENCNIPQITIVIDIIEKTAKHFFELGLKVQKDNIRHSMDETPKYPCDILFVTDVDTVFLYRYMENGRPVDRETPYFRNIQNGKCWYYCNDIMYLH